MSGSGLLLLVVAICLVVATHSSPPPPPQSSLLAATNEALRAALASATALDDSDLSDLPPSYQPNPFQPWQRAQDADSDGEDLDDSNNNSNNNNNNNNIPSIGASDEEPGMQHLLALRSLYQPYAAQHKRSCLRRGGACDYRPRDCCGHSSCRCNLWGQNCRCQRMGLFQKWG